MRRTIAVLAWLAAFASAAGAEGLATDRRPGPTFAGQSPVAAAHGFAPGPPGAPPAPPAAVLGDAPGVALASPVALATGALAARPMSGDGDRAQRRGGPHLPGLTGERAQALLRSLTLPGWGQASLGKRRSATVFAVLEAGVWGSFAAFKLQQAMRTESYLNTAQIHAGIDLSDRSDEYRRLVGIYPSSEYYNLYVVYRDAANLYYDDPAQFEAYIARNSVTGDGAWAWTDPEAFERYRAQRRDVHRAGLRANTALAVAIANRLLSAVHAARAAGKPAPARSWRLEVAPDLNQPGSFAVGVRTDF